MSEFFELSFPARRNSVRRAVQGLSLFAAAMAVAGCGSNLRPTVTPILGTGPAPQPTAYAFVVSNPAASGSQGIGTLIDYSGDTIAATAQIGPAPIAGFTLNSGSIAWTINGDGTVSNIAITTPTNLQNKNITYSTLSPFQGTDPVVGLFGGAVGLFAFDVNLNEIDLLTGSPDSFKQVVPVDTAPVTLVGVSAATRYYSVSQAIPFLSCTGAAVCAPNEITLDGNTVDAGVACNIDPHSSDLASSVGVADGIETSTYSTPSAHIQVGVCPVYAVGTPDTKRVFVLNRGSDTISVINSQNNTLDSCVCPPQGCQNQSGQFYTCHPTIPLSTAAVTATGIPPVNPTTSSLPAIAGPVYAEYNAATGFLVISDYDGNAVSVIDVSLDEYGNDSGTFGTTYTIPVGLKPGVGSNPASVTVLADGSRAYTANQSDGSVSIVNLSSFTVEKTVPINGHPRTVVSTQNSSYGRVYAVAPDSPYVSIIRTDEDILSTTVLVEGNAVDVRTNSPDAINPNLNLVSRLPGAGQPCNLPLSELPAAQITMANCKYQDASLLTSSVRK